MNTPRPALVTQEAARRLPRLALWLLCLAYVLPGFVGRQPWKGDDLASFGFMQAMAEGRTGWLAPQLDGLSPDVAALLPYWLGALALKATAGWLAPDVAVRLPFALMLAGTLAATWYATYNLTRLPGAQPVALAFGGEAQPRDYARALADGSLLALIATLGMAQLAHETTPALAQLCFTALVFFGFAAMPFQPRAAVAATLLGLPALALSGAPTLALAYGAAAVLAQLWPGWQAAAPANALQAGARRRLLLATLAAMLASAALGWRLGLWRWQITWPLAAAQWRSLARLFAWFTWPIWPLALWTLWRWRAQLPRPRQQRHLGLPLMMAGMAMLAAVFTPARDRSLLAALPPLAALAALALPTLRRGMAALIDWFTVLFFSGWAIVIWVVWISLQTGVPAKPAANVARLAPGFEPVFQWPALLAALAATLAWAWLARWRTGRHRAAPRPSRCAGGKRRCGSSSHWSLRLPHGAATMVGPAVSPEVLGLVLWPKDASVASPWCAAGPHTTAPASRSNASRRWGMVAKYASSASSTRRVARAPTSRPAAVVVTIRARASLGSCWRRTRPACSSLRST